MAMIVTMMPKTLVVIVLGVLQIGGEEDGRFAGTRAVGGDDDGGGGDDDDDDGGGGDDDDDDGGDGGGDGGVVVWCRR